MGEKDQKAETPSEPLPLDIKDKLQKLVPDENKRQEVLTIIEAAWWSAPLPPPVLLKQYNEVLPGLAERIVTLTEEQSKHRRTMEDTIVKSQSKESHRGQLFGLVIGLSGLGAALWLGLAGHDAVAATIGGGTLVGLVTVFVTGRRKQRQELKEKAKGK